MVEMALRIVRMQQHHDLWHAEQALQEQLDLIQPAALPQA